MKIIVKTNATIEHSTDISLKVINRVILWSSNPLLCYLSIWIDVSILKRYSYTLMFNGNTIHSSQDVETTQISFDKWTDKMRYIHITENYLALNTSEILPSAVTWMNLVGGGGWALCSVKRASVRRTNPAWLHSCEETEIAKLAETENGGYLGLGGGRNGDLLINGNKISSMQDVSLEGATAQHCFYSQQYCILHWKIYEGSFLIKYSCYNKIED